jgi:DNA-binding CsgD family transcriptional regulator
MPTNFLGWIGRKLRPTLHAQFMDDGDQMSDGYHALTDKEKDTLRLLLRGYDAKSIARHFELSVHTVNERLRNARQKMAASSSREAARLLGECERSDPQKSVDKEIGGDGDSPTSANILATTTAGGTRGWGRLAIAGVIAMSLLFAAMLATSTLTSSPPSAGVSATVTTQGSKDVSSSSSDTAVQSAANEWLALVDAYRWADAYAATATSFRELNSLEKWTEVASKVQPQLGKVITRDHRSTEFVPAPPFGYEMVKFKSSFEHTPNTSETLTLVKEDGKWKVTGYWLD